MDPDSDPDTDPDPIIFVIDLTKNFFFTIVFLLLLFKVHLHHVSKIKSPKEVTKQ